MTTHQDIRGALQARLLTVSQLPKQIAYEGRVFDPALGIPYISVTLKPTSGKPFSVDGDVTYERGLFLVDLYYPISGGSASVEIAADSVISKFKSGTRLKCNSTEVFVDYAERVDVLVQDGWLHLPVTVGWRSYPTA